VRDGEIRAITRLVERDMARHLDEHLRGIELHAQHIRKGKGPWRSVPPRVKSGVLQSVSETLGRFSAPQGCALFGVVRAPGAVPSARPLERCFEELFLRFTLMLRRIEASPGEEMGLVIADRLDTKTRFSRSFRSGNGHPELASAVSRAWPRCPSSWIAEPRGSPRPLTLSLTACIGITPLTTQSSSTGSYRDSMPAKESCTGLCTSFATISPAVAQLA
jgi:hypothetical protein